MRRDTANFNFSVNGFRGLCVLLVFVYHVINSGLLPKPPYESMLASWLFFVGSSFRYGVELFFMISGYVIVNSLCRHASISAFLLDRCARIFPVWVPVLIGVFVAGSLLGLRSFHHLSATQQLLTFVGNLLLIPPLISMPVAHDASWSLTYEWLFYLLAASAAAIAAISTSAWRWSLAVLLGLLTVTLLGVLPRALFFIPGVLLGLGWLPLQKMRDWLHSPLLGLVLFLLTWRGVNLDEARPAAYALSDFLTGMPLLLTLLSLLAGGYVFACICSESSGTGWLRSRGMQVLGNMSYSFYLWHPIVMFGTKRIAYALLVERIGMPLSALVFALTSFVIAVAVSYTSYRLFEVHLGKALRQFFKQRRSVVATDAGAIGAMHVEGR